MLQGLGLILLGSIALMVYARLQLSGLSGDAAMISSRLKTTRAQLATVSAEYGPRKKDAVLEQEVQKLENGLAAQRRVLAMVRSGDLGNTDGYSEYFRALSRQIVHGLWLTGLVIDGSGNAIALHGRALQPELVPEYINRLKQEPVMKGKSFSGLQMSVPLIDAGKKNGEDGAAKVPANYIEFSLQSSDASADPAGGQ
jgi:hypothetical protein